MDTLPAKGKGVGLLLILLLTVFFATAAANPASGQVQLPTANLGDTNFEDGFGDMRVYQELETLKRSQSAD